MHWDFGSTIVIILLFKGHREIMKLPKESAKRKIIQLTLVRGINTFRGTGNPDEAAYSCAALSLASVKRVPSTKRANQKGRGKSFKR